MEELHRCYVENKIQSEHGFIATLKLRLDPERPAIKQLCAETVWFYYLFPSNITVATKRERVETCWGWSGARLHDDRYVLAESSLAGAGSAGVAYSTYMWREFRFFWAMMVDWFNSPQNERETLSREPWEFAQWLDGREFSAGRMLRHVILYLLFPEWFEPIATASHKCQIIRKLYAEAISVDLNAGTELDRAVLTVRQGLEKRFPEIEVNFYLSPVKELWQTSANAPPPPPPPVEPDTNRLSDEEATAWFSRKFPENTRVWWLSSGTGGHLWPEFAKRGVAVLSHGDLGDLSEYETREQMTSDLVDLSQGSRPWNRSLALWQFSREMQVNDVIIAHYGGLHVVGWGQVKGDYTYDLDRPEYPHRRPVDWHACDPPITAPHRAVAKALTDFSPYLPFVHQVFLED